MRFRNIFNLTLIYKMQTHHFNVTEQQLKKILNGKTCQLTNGALNEGSAPIVCSKKQSTKILRALRTGKGCRIKLGMDEVAATVEANAGYEPMLSKATRYQLAPSEVEGGSIKGDFKKFGRTLNKAIVKPLNEKVIRPIVQNKEGILRSIAAVGVPLVTSAVSKYTGLNFNGGNKIMSNYADRRIRKDMGKKAPPAPAPAPPIETTPVQPYETASSSEVAGLGFKMVPRKMPKPIGKSSVKPKNFDNIKPALDGGALYLPGRGLYLP